jgi:hypothetical protein
MGALHPRVSFVFLGNSKLSSLWFGIRYDPGQTWTNPNCPMIWSRKCDEIYVNGPSQPQPQPPKKLSGNQTMENHPLIHDFPFFTPPCTEDFQSLVALGFPANRSNSSNFSWPPWNPGGSQPLQRNQRDICLPKIGTVIHSLLCFWWFLMNFDDV